MPCQTLLHFIVNYICLYFILNEGHKSAHAGSSLKNGCYSLLIWRLSAGRRLMHRIKLFLSNIIFKSIIGVLSFNQLTFCLTIWFIIFKNYIQSSIFTWLSISWEILSIFFIYDICSSQKQKIKVPFGFLILLLELIGL